VDYEEEKITFLGACLNRAYGYEDGGDDELHWTTAKAFFNASGISKKDVVETKQFFNHPQNPDHLPFGPEIYKYLKEKNTKNKEGFVLRFFPSNFRCKIKFEDYIALHRIVTQVSSYDIWENLRDNGKLPESFLSNVPDEFYDWVKKTETEVLENFRFLKSLHYAHVSSILRYEIENRKMIAEAFMKIKDDRVNSGVLFSILDGKNPDLKIWDMAKPRYSRPFSEKVEL
jgi:RNA ligase